MPTEKLDEIEELDSSAGSDLDESGKAAKAVEADGAESSAATDEADDDGTLSIVRDAVDKSKPDPTAAASSAEGEEAGEDADDDSQPKKPDDEDYSDVPFHKHPRFQHLLRKSKVFEADAKSYQAVQSFMDSNGLSNEEAANALTTAALIKSDPSKAWEQLKPVVQDLLRAVGAVLPDDLSQRVQKGELTREAAAEISKERAKAHSVQSQRTFEQQQAERRQQGERQRSCVQAVEEWEAGRFRNDPAFKAKMPALQREIAYLQRVEGVPNAPDGVKDQLKRAYKVVNDAVPAVTPAAAQTRRPALRPVTGGQVAGNVRPKVETTADVIDSVLSKRAAGR